MSDEQAAVATIVYDVRLDKYHTSMPTGVYPFPTVASLSTLDVADPTAPVSQRTVPIKIDHAFIMLSSLRPEDQIIFHDQDGQHIATGHPGAYYDWQNHHVPQEHLPTDEGKLHLKMHLNSGHTTRFTFPSAIPGLHIPPSVAAGIYAGDVMTDQEKEDFARVANRGSVSDYLKILDAQVNRILGTLEDRAGLDWTAFKGVVTGEPEGPSIVNTTTLTPEPWELGTAYQISLGTDGHDIKFEKRGDFTRWALIRPSATASGIVSISVSPLLVGSIHDETGRPDQTDYSLGATIYVRKTSPTGPEPADEIELLPIKESLQTWLRSPEVRHTLNDYNDLDQKWHAEARPGTMSRLNTSLSSWLSNNADRLGIHRIGPNRSGESVLGA